MRMPGGGVFSLKPGQFTDDSQLSCHLLRGLLKMGLNSGIDEQHYQIIKNISEQYVEWLNLKPFDIGNTCKKGIRILKKHIDDIQNKNEAELKSLFHTIFEEIYIANK